MIGPTTATTAQSRSVLQRQAGTAEQPRHDEADHHRQGGCYHQRKEPAPCAPPGGHPLEPPIDQRERAEDDSDNQHDLQA